MRMSGGQMTFGAVAVDGFFIISGFLITASWMRRPKLGDYLKKRVSRIYPGFIGATVFCFALSPVAGMSIHALLAWRQLLKIGAAAAVLEPYPSKFLFLSNPVREAFNASAWTIRFEFFCYLLLPLMAWTRLLRNRPAVLATLVAVMTLVVVDPQFNLKRFGRAGVFIGDPEIWLRFASCFLTGTCVWLYREQMRYSVILATAAFAAIVAAVVTRHGLQTTVTIAGGYLVFWLAFAKWLKLSRFGKFGDFSYGIYLYAFPIQQLLRQWIGGRLNAYELFAIAWPASVVAGILSWHLVERHFLKTSHSTRPAIAEPGPAVAATD
jgi:peptidoglycan/LPS O-acetylase OafA/YrhL